MSRFRIGLILAGALVVLVGAAGGEEGTPSVTVWVYNYSNVPAGTVEEAEVITTWVMEQAGLGVEWVEFRPGVRRPLRSSDLVLRLVPEAMIANWGLDGKHLAFSLVPPDSQSNYIAGVITDRVEEVAGRERYPLAMVLGHVMAHELGHLLLGNKRHSVAGIMSFPVNRGYLVRASKGLLRFAPSEQRRIRREVRRRSADVAASG